MTIEDYVRTTKDCTLVEIYDELQSGVIPKYGAARSYCRSINNKIDVGLISTRSYRKIYLPSLARVILEELATRYVAGVRQ